VLFTDEPREFPAPIGVGESGQAVTDAELRNSDIADWIANPAKCHFFNTDCASCQSETTRRAIRGVDRSSVVYATPVGVPGLDSDVSPTDQWNVRNLGWFRNDATITQRTANETAEVVDFINREVLSHCVPIVYVTQCGCRRNSTAWLDRDSRGIDCRDVDGSKTIKVVRCQFATAVGASRGTSGARASLQCTDSLEDRAGRRLIPISGRDRLGTLDSAFRQQTSNKVRFSSGKSRELQPFQLVRLAVRALATSYQRG
jgi:hypothetical protein